MSDELTGQVHIWVVMKNAQEKIDTQTMIGDHDDLDLEIGDPMDSIEETLDFSYCNLWLKDAITSFTKLGLKFEDARRFYLLFGEDFSTNAQIGEVPSISGAYFLGVFTFVIPDLAS